MNSFPQQFSPPDASNVRAPHHRKSGDFRPRAAHGAMTGTNGHAPLPVPSVPVPHTRIGNGQSGNLRGMSSFDGPRSPPNNKNTSHVPCKFYRQGTCQAGKACPFLHADAVAPCKYYQKGNCKFGMRCANEHIMADGRRVNRPGFGMGGNALGLGGRVPLPPNSELGPGSSLLSMQHAHLVQPQSSLQPSDDHAFSSQLKSQYDIPSIDTTFSSHPGSTYGSPPNDGRLPISPVQKGLSVLDAPLPASFDSQGISHMARYGPIAASVPSRFGFDISPPSSLPTKAIGESSALRNLHSSAFGDDNRNGRDVLGSSPPVPSEEPVGRRIMHSERFARPKAMSSSVGARAPIHDDWDDNFAFEEDLVPNSLQELLTPQEKMRRFSRTGEDDQPGRQSLSGLGTPTESSSKVGSPSTASPSRFGALFSRSQKTENNDSGLLPGASAFGHVGSPLRNSPLNPGASPSLRATSRHLSGDVSPFVSSPPRQASMSMISQQLQRTRLSSRASEENVNAPVHPGLARVSSGGSVTSSSGVGRLDRAVSSSSVGRSEKIVEEEDGLFSMDDMAPRDNSKRYSGGAWGAIGKGSPNLGAIGGQRNKDNPWGNGT